MNRKIRLVIVFGTRPEAIKLAPIILLLQKDNRFECKVCVSGQHKEMLYQVLEIFGIIPDIDLELMQPGQGLASLSASLITAISNYLSIEKPDIILVQGDTTTALCAALSAFYCHIPIGHIEAGLRTRNMASPWPEEANRVLVTRLADLHFAPTEANAKNLIQDGINQNRIYITGNTVIDTLLMTVNKITQKAPRINNLPDFLQPGESNNTLIVLITGHRRESFGEGFEKICQAIAILALNFPDIHFVYPVHLNPNVQEPVKRLLKKTNEDSILNNIHLIEPLDYLSFVALMNKSHLIITDSGGIQEEAPSLGKPVIVIRDFTERMEAVEAGTVKLVGTSIKSIVEQTSQLLTDEKAYRNMACAHNPYGDGLSSKRIINICYDYIKENSLMS